MHIRKRGLSPIIATMLLILIAVVIATIIFLWARSYLAEKAQKDIGDGLQAIEKACEAVNFNADVTSGGNVRVSNIGNVPLYGVEVRKKTTFSVSSCGGVQAFGNGNTPLLSGEDGSVTVSCGLSSGNSVLVVPVLQGQVGAQLKSYTCDDAQAVTVTVS